MRKTAIMQPYLFPYIGYFQLIHAVDTFVIYDDVQFIKRGFINRNKILVNKNEHLFTFSVKKAPREYKINERFYSEDFYEQKERFLQTISRNYKHSKNYSEIYGILNNILEVDIKDNVAKINYFTIKAIAEYLDINTKFLFSSDLDIPKGLKGQDRILTINSFMKSRQYINAIGGKELYSKEDFLKFNMDLKFLQTKRIEYNQDTNQFIPNLSIIDVLMYNRKEEVKKFLDAYKLI
ncbi:WbqC family protein [Gracilibacillus thailandensis]|jgi:hypothetical protein|uniref:Glycine transferase n=1 Tax=Gracilibacillus thailandensis TaxID=563735 RepID=A0A6N7R0I1_9BACI|nr:WbqC family protein [Gracilibacillus thailandensis]MRI67032.1 hypothetical protein [Gracilibacillus thailandensis]